MSEHAQPQTEGKEHGTPHASTHGGDAHGGHKEEFKRTGKGALTFLILSFLLNYGVAALLRWDMNSVAGVLIGTSLLTYAFLPMAVDFVIFLVTGK